MLSKLRSALMRLVRPNASTSGMAILPRGAGFAITEDNAYSVMRILVLRPRDLRDDRPDAVADPRAHRQGPEGGRVSPRGPPAKPHAERRTGRPCLAGTHAASLSHLGQRLL